MTIYIDPRKGSGTQGDIISYSPLAELAQLKRLNSADIWFSGNGPSGKLEFGIEIKTISSGDLFSSIEDNRLQATQVPRLLNDYDHPWLLTIGTFRPTVHGTIEILDGNQWKTYEKVDEEGDRYSSNITYALVVSRLADVQYSGVLYYNVPDLATAAVWIVYQYRLFSKPWVKRRGMYGFDTSRRLPLIPKFRRGNSKYDKEFKQRAISAFSIDGIGTVKAMVMAEYFNSFQSIGNATVEELQEIGFGEKFSIDLQKKLRGER